MLVHQVAEILEEIRPQLQADGGDVQLITVVDGVVKVKLKGACQNCPNATLTLKMGIERILKERLPEIKRVDSLN